MSKKKKLNLEVVRVQSFVTSLENDQKNRIKGGQSMDTVCCPDYKTEGPCPGYTEGDVTCLCWTNYGTCGC